MMKPCFLKIVTVVDGEESIFSQEAEMELFSESAKLRYFENGGKVSLHISNGQVTVAREGDYILRLLLKEGKKNRGIIGVSGSEGEVETVTHKIGFAAQIHKFREHGPGHPLLPLCGNSPCVSRNLYKGRKNVPARRGFSSEFDRKRGFDREAAGKR